MKNFRFKKIDAFATVASDGNPAGYILLDTQANISPAEMLKIAQELKGFVNEVGYLRQVQQSEFDLTFYSAEREVDFCGHATIAIMYDLIGKDQSLSEINSLKINTNRGTLSVENRIKTEDAVFIMSPLPVEVKVLPDLVTIALALKITVSEIDDELPIKIINAGLNTLLVPIRSLKSILSIKPELNELKTFCIQSGIDIIEVFTSDTVNENSDYRVRVFAPTFGYLEDPATGSGNSALGYYLKQQGLWNKSIISIEQNGLHDNFNKVKLQMKHDDEGNERILFGGGAVTRIEGEYSLH